MGMIFSASEVGVHAEKGTSALAVTLMLVAIMHFMTDGDDPYGVFGLTPEQYA
ncbi:hypothetical protein ACQEU3_10495 [Spirillospora sp. CA-253888]